MLLLHTATEPLMCQAETGLTAKVIEDTFKPSMSATGSNKKPHLLVVFGFATRY